MHEITLSDAMSVAHGVKKAAATGRYIPLVAIAAAKLADELESLQAHAKSVEEYLRKMREQEPVAWMVVHDDAQQIDLTLLKTEAESIGREMQEYHFNHGADGVRIPARITALYAAHVPAVAAPAVPEECGHLHQRREHKS